MLNSTVGYQYTDGFGLRWVTGASSLSLGSESENTRASFYGLVDTLVTPINATIKVSDSHNLSLALLSQHFVEFCLSFSDDKDICCHQQ